jgi:hypothetical protein
MTIKNDCGWQNIPTNVRRNSSIIFRHKPNTQIFGYMARGHLSYFYPFGGQLGTPVGNMKRKNIGEKDK